MSLHPHVHCIVSGGGIRSCPPGAEQPGVRWKNPKRIKDNFLFPVNAMRIVFRPKFLQGLKSLHENKLIRLWDGYNLQQLINNLYKKKCNLYGKATCAGPQQSLPRSFGVIEYLGRYTNKVAISNYRIVANDTVNGRVSFRYKDYRSIGTSHADGDKTKLLLLEGAELVGGLSSIFCRKDLPGSAAMVI
ncbi:MAG TPA: transposase [Chitinophagaceae bacterium]|nr:transposase [Chitinophagaceae bacterium]